MKTLKTILILFLSGCSSMMTVDQGEFEKLKQVNEVDQPKAVIFDRSIQWIARNYGSSKEVLELTDKENLKLQR